MEKQKDLSMTILLDYYGDMLTEKQKEMMSLYYEQDMSLAEIAEEKGVTRQAVLGTLHKTVDLLKGYEKSLGLARKTHDLNKDIKELEYLIVAARISDAEVRGDIEDKIVDIKKKL